MNGDDWRFFATVLPLALLVAVIIWALLTYGFTL